MPNYEIEIRGLLTKDQFDSILDDLKGRADKFEEDNRETLFFMIPNATLKVAKMVSKKLAKIAYKSGDIVRSAAQREIEFSIPIDACDDAIEMFSLLGFADTQSTSQIRYNAVLGDIEISLKWSKDWGYHFEAEIISQTESDIDGLKERLESYCASIGLNAMTSAEFEGFRQQIDASHKK